MQTVKHRYLELVTLLDEKQSRYFSAGQAESRQLTIEMDAIRTLIRLHESILGVNHER